MDATTMALNLINAYKREHNRLRRAKRTKLSILCNTKFFMDDMKLNGFNVHITNDREYKFTTHQYRLLRNFFQVFNGITSHFPHLGASPPAFVSAAVKRSVIRLAELKIAQLECDGTNESNYSRKLRDELAALKIKPVLKALGKTWQRYVDAHKEECDADEARWQARCAIYAFNKMNAGIQIKFGNSNRHGGSISYINHVVIDGDKIKLRKFLDNAEFESAVLNAPT